MVSTLSPSLVVRAAGVFLSAVLLSGCSSDALFGEGPGAEATVTTPSGVQSGLVTISYTPASSRVTQSDIAVTYSEDGTSFRTASAGPGGSGTENLTVSATGVSHTFVWDSGSDLDGERIASITLRIRPDDGTSDSTSGFSVHNSRFLVAVENRSIGRVRLYKLDVVDGDLVFASPHNTGGTDPYEILFDDGFYFVAHESSDNVAVFKLDEANETLVSAANSPFATDGSGSKYLATDGNRFFVSNVGTGTITVFDFDTADGELTLNPNSGVAVAGCRSLVARSGHLYVASETAGSIRIFDIAGDGELIENAASPATGGGLASPRAVVVAGTRLFAANATSASLAGFVFLGDGSLTTLAGSPFSISNLGVEQLAQNGSKLFAVTGSGQRFLSMTVDATGTVTKDSTSPEILSGSASGVVSGGSIAVTATTASEEIYLWTIDSAGAVAPASPSPRDSGVQILRMAASD